MVTSIKMDDLAGSELGPHNLFYQHTAGGTFTITAAGAIASSGRWNGNLTRVAAGRYTFTPSPGFDVTGALPWVQCNVGVAEATQFVQAAPEKYFATALAGPAPGTVHIELLVMSSDAGPPATVNIVTGDPTGSNIAVLSILCVGRRLLRANNPLVGLDKPNLVPSPTGLAAG